MSFITTEISSFSTFTLVDEKYSYDYKCIFYRKGSHLFVYSIIGYDKSVKCRAHNFYQNKCGYGFKRCRLKSKNSC